MDFQRLQLLLEEIQVNIDDFKKEITESEDLYQRSIKLIVNPDSRSLSMERHIIHVERQRAALAKMETLYDQVKTQLARR